MHEHATGLSYVRGVASRIIAEYGAHVITAYVFSVLAILVAPLCTAAYMIYIYKSYVLKSAP